MEGTDFLPDTDRGKEFCAELDAFAARYGLTPHQALEDPALPFNATVWRVAVAERVKRIDVKSGADAEAVSAKVSLVRYVEGG